MLTIAEVRARGIELPSDVDAAQAVIDEQEAWLERKIGPLDGERTETFYVGISRTWGKLALSRYTDEVVVVDGTTIVDPAILALVDRGSAVTRVYPASWWTGPYVSVTYTPTDEDEVRRALYELVAGSTTPLGPYESEQIGSYSYRRGGAPTTAASRAALASAILPVRDPLLTLAAISRRVNATDPVINRPEYEPWDATEPGT